MIVARFFPQTLDVIYFKYNALNMWKKRKVTLYQLPFNFSAPFFQFQKITIGINIKKFKNGCSKIFSQTLKVIYFKYNAHIMR